MVGTVPIATTDADRLLLGGVIFARSAWNFISSDGTIERLLARYSGGVPILLEVRRGLWLGVSLGDDDLCVILTRFIDASDFRGSVLAFDSASLASVTEGPAATRELIPFPIRC